MRRFALACLLVSCVLPATQARAGGPAMLIGATEDSVRQPTPAKAKAEMDLLVRAGFNAVRVTQIWAPGQTEPSAADLRILRNVVEAARQDRVQVLLTVMNFGNRTTPLTDEARTDFASYAAALAAALPQVRYFVIGNEPNLNRYWLPQFNADGSDAAAPAYEALLAQTYDALKAVSSKIVVLGGAVSPRGGDVADSIRPTHSPTAFLTDLGASYRASGRTKPIMDALTMHPYEDNSSVAPVDGVHPNSTTIALADYDKLVTLLGTAFAGTAQRGSNLPIYFDEFGVEAQIPPAKASLYTGREPETIKPVPEAVQGQYYRQAIQLAFCQPNVRGLFLFHAIDEPDLNRWQSGLYYVDESPKSDLGAVRAAISEAHRGVVTRCPGLALRPRASLAVVLNPFPQATLLCNIDCTYVVTLRRGSRVIRRLRGRAVGGLSKRIRLGHLDGGASYTATASLRAPVNPGRPMVVRALPFAVP
jgi:Cellulase (glycosyl hydrolase family 5)